MSLFDRWASCLEQLRHQGRFRSLTLPAGIDFTSNDYLGYSAGRGPGLLDDIPLSKSGAASRLLRGHHPIWEEVESQLAGWHGAEAALMLTSGYVANEGLLSAIVEPGDWVASDQFNHASIIDGLRLSRAERFLFRHNDLGQLEAGLKEVSRHRSVGRQLFIVTESLFSMEGDTAPLKEMAELARRHEAHLIVDEAHATGCFGPAGSGLVDALGLRPHVLATVHTGGKALGVAGAYVCGSARLKEVLVNRCRQFIFTTALPPVVGAWWLQMLPFVRADQAGRVALHQNARTFREVLQQNGIGAPGEHYIIPVIVGAEERAVEAARRLQTHGYDIRVIRPPTVPVGTSRLRISIHASQEFDILEKAAFLLTTVMKQIGPIIP